MELGQDNLAEANFKKAIAQYSQFTDAKFYLARIYRDTYRITEAKDLLTEAKLNLEAGYIINEDNSYYEEYPYQVKSYWIKK